MKTSNWHQQLKMAAIALWFAGGTAAAETGKIIRIKGTMDSAKYQAIFNDSSKVGIRSELEHPTEQLSEVSKLIHKRMGT